MAFQSIRRIIPQAIQKAGIDSEVSAARVLDEAKNALVRIWGEERAAYVEPSSFKDGDLRLTIRSASAAQMFRTIESQVRNEVNRAIGQQRVRRIIMKREGF